MRSAAFYNLGSPDAFAAIYTKGRSGKARFLLHLPLWRLSFWRLPSQASIVPCG